MRYEYKRLGDLEIEGKLQLDDESVQACQCTLPDAPYTDDCTPSAREYRACAQLVNELKDKLNALIGAIT